MTRPLRRLAGTLAAVGLATTGCGSLPDTSDAVDVTASRVPEVVVRTASPTPVPGPASTPASPTPGRVATASPTPSAAPSPTPPPTSTPTPTPAQVVTYGPDGLFRTEDGERRQLLDTPIRLAFDDGRGGAIFQRNDIGIGQVVDGEVVTLAFVQEPATIELLGVDAAAGTFTYRTVQDGTTRTWVQAMDPEAEPRPAS